jgi:transposase
MKAMGLSAPLAAAIVGASVATLRRWEHRLKSGAMARLRRGPRKVRALSAEKRRELSDVVRKMRGICGADSLSHSVSGVSRRQAAAIKAATLCELERERV